VSARSMFQKESKIPTEWKVKAFSLILKSHVAQFELGLKRLTDLIRELNQLRVLTGQLRLVMDIPKKLFLVSIGDSSVDMDAARLTARQAPRAVGFNVVCKTIKLDRKPSLDHLVEQHIQLRKSGLLERCLNSKGTFHAKYPFTGEDVKESL
jgi:hypothetical protein